MYWEAADAPRMYTWGENDFLRAFGRSGRGFEPNAISQGLVRPPEGMPGAMLSISANGDKDGIVWANHPSDGDAAEAVRHGVLRAFDAHDLTNELWNSLAKPEDDFGNFAKFVAPTVANGKVYMATFSQRVFVYGLRP